jgi:hypothetical protein
VAISPAPAAAAAPASLLRLLIALAVGLALLASFVAPARAADPVPSPAGEAPAATAPETRADEGGGLVQGLAREVVEEVRRWWELGFAGYVLRAVLAVVGLFGDFLFDLLSPVCCGALNFVTRTPPELSYANPAVVGLWRSVRTVANGALAVVALWGGVNVMVRHHLGEPYDGAAALFPRLAVGALLANTSLWWAGLAVDLNNDLAALVGLGAPFPAWERLAALDRASTDGIAFVVYAVVGVLLVLQQAGRLALVDLLLAVAPLGLLCWVLPQTQRWAALWSATFARTVFVQFLQAAALKLGAALLAAWAAGVGAPLPNALAILLGVGVLGLTLRLPRLLQVHASSGLDFARFYGYRAGARALDGQLAPGRGGGSGGIARAAGGTVAQAAPLPPAARATTLAVGGGR